MAVLSSSRLCKYHSFYVKINGTVGEFYDIFNQSLILGVMYTGWIGRTAVIFREGDKIFIDDKLFAEISDYQDNSYLNTFKVMHGFLASPYQVLLALRLYGFAVGIMTERKDGNEYFGFLRLARHFINNLKFVSGKINIHLITGIVLDMTDNLNVKSVFKDNPFKGRQLIAVRIFGMILLE